MEDGEASGAQADASHATRPISEACSETVQEPESDSHPPDTSDREATELHPWPIERAPTTPKPGAGWREHAAHWAHRISLSAKVPPHASRDHLANERTFLGWVRTSIAFAILGTVIAQLFRLQHSPTPRPFGFYALGVPLASTCHGLALLMVLVGAQRYRTQQNAMVVGRIKAGGWGPWLVGGFVTVVS